MNELFASGDCTTREILDRIKDGYCAVLGAGVSNLPLIELLRAQGARICVRDRKNKCDHKNAALIESLADAYIDGVDYLRGLDTDTPPEKTVIFRSPGLRHDLPEISSAVEKGAILTSEMELFFRLTRANIIAITGSDGKTTTTTLIGKLLQKGKKQGRVFVGGNIGKPLLPENNTMTEEDHAVVELSSFQLQTMNISARTAVITNITPNHLNWHTDMDEYTGAKYNVFMGEGCEHLVACADNCPALEAARIAMKRANDMRVTLFSLKGSDYDSVVPEDLRGENTDAVYERDGMIVYHRAGREHGVMKSADIKIPGRHNVLNYMAALAATAEFVPPEAVRELAVEFGGVEHRIELVREHRGVRYYNSSIDSTPTRTTAALSSFDCKLIVICGGKNKNLSFEPLAEILCRKAKAVVLTGESADEIMEALNACGEYQSSGISAVIERDFEAAVKRACEIAVDGDTVILSPACTSFDAFDNFEERGNFFKKIVNSF